MSFSRVTSGLNFIGGNESSLASIANNATSNGSEIDVLGGDNATGDIVLYLVLTSTVTTGSIDIAVNFDRVTGQTYSQPSKQFSIAPTNGTQMIRLGRFKASRYMWVSVTNNATGASASVAVLGELYKAQ